MTAAVDSETVANPHIPSRAIHRGDLFWIEPDEAHGSVPGYPHPHVVVQDDVFNRSRINTVIVCALSSNLKRANEPGNCNHCFGLAGAIEQHTVTRSQRVAAELATGFIDHHRVLATSR